MKLTVSTHGSVTAIEPAGAIAARAVGEFERKVLEQVAGGCRHLVLDFSRVELLTGDGIRVLMLLSRQLQAADGTLVLCGLSDAVRSVFEVAGLLPQFSIVETRDEAIGRLSSAEMKGEPGAGVSKLARLVRRLLEDEPSSSGESAASDPPPPGLTRHVAALLSRQE